MGVALLVEEGQGEQHRLHDVADEGSLLPEVPERGWEVNLGALGNDVDAVLVLKGKEEL